jgi:hypothetical protein
MPQLGCHSTMVYRSRTRSALGRYHSCRLHSLTGIRLASMCLTVYCGSMRRCIVGCRASEVWKFFRWQSINTLFATEVCACKPQTKLHVIPMDNIPCRWKTFKHLSPSLYSKFAPSAGWFITTEIALLFVSLARHSILNPGRYIYKLITDNRCEEAYTSECFDYTANYLEILVVPGLVHCIEQFDPSHIVHDHRLNIISKWLLLDNWLPMVFGETNIWVIVATSS